MDGEITRDFKHYRFAFLGPQCSGKTVSINSFTVHSFDHRYIPTTYPNFCQLSCQIDQTEILVSICDCSGDELLIDIGPLYYKDALTVFIMLDKSDRASFDKVDLYIKNAKQSCLPKAFLVLVGNKCDLDPAVSFEEAQEKAQKFELSYFEMSAKTMNMSNYIFDLISLFYN